MITIHLNNLSFFAYHGLYESERQKGNRFLINATLEYNPLKHIADIGDTIDYADIYGLITKRMEIATPLLETIVMDIANEVFEKFPLAESIWVQLTKLDPPIENFKGSVSVSYLLKR